MNSKGHVFQRLLDGANICPDTLFCTYVKGNSKTELTFGAVVSRAGSIVAAFDNICVPSAAIIFIILEHSEDLYASFVGSVLAGTIPSFMPPMTRKQDPEVYRASLSSLVKRIEPFAILCSAKSFADLPELGIPVLRVDDISHAGGLSLAALNERASRLDPSSIAFLQHSSGTTGLKKGVKLSQEAVLEQCWLYARAIAIEPGDSIVSWLPLYHDMGLIACFLMPAIVGVPIVSLDAFEWVLRPTMLLKHITRHQARFVWLPNFAFQHILRMDNGAVPWDLRSVKAIVSCSEPCRSAPFDAFFERYCNGGLKREALQVSYALAENIFAVTHTPAGFPASQGTGEATRGFVSCGRVLPSMGIEIRDADGHIVTDAEIDEIWIMSPCLFDGYFKQPEKTKEKLVGSWYRTGDLGTFEADELFVIGRVDDLIIVNGKNIMAHEVEDQLNSVSGLIPGRVLVHGEYDEELGTSQLMVVAQYVHPGEEARVIAADIRNSVYTVTGVYPVETAFVEPGFRLKSTSGKRRERRATRNSRNLPQPWKGSHDRGGDLSPSTRRDARYAQGRKVDHWYLTIDNREGNKRMGLAQPRRSDPQYRKRIQYRAPARANIRTR